MKPVRGAVIQYGPPRAVKKNRCIRTDGNSATLFNAGVSGAEFLPNRIALFDITINPQRYNGILRDHRTAPRGCHRVARQRLSSCQGLDDSGSFTVGILPLQESAKGS